MHRVIEVARRHVPPDQNVALFDLTADLRSIGIGSLEAVALICDLESTMSIQFPADMIDRENFRNLASIAEAVRKVCGYQRGDS